MTTARLRDPTDGRGSQDSSCSLRDKGYGTHRAGAAFASAVRNPVLVEECQGDVQQLATPPRQPPTLPASARLRLLAVNDPELKILCVVSRPAYRACEKAPSPGEPEPLDRPWLSARHRNRAPRSW
jgi:hypothetical protein